MAVWHGTKKCINGAKLPKANRIAGQPCPFCGNTIGAYVGADSSAQPEGDRARRGERAQQLMAEDPSLSWTQAWGKAEREQFEERRAQGNSDVSSAFSIEQQLANLQRLHDDGLTSDAEYEERRERLLDEAVAPPIPQPRQVLRPPAAPATGEGAEPRRRGSRKVVAAVLLGLIVVVVVVLASQDDDGASGTTSGSPAGRILDAIGDVDGRLLGSAWIGSGTYTLHDAAKAYSASEDFTAYAARISVTGAEDLCLYWYSGGQAPGDGLTIGDTLTRQFSDWGSVAEAGSQADDTVRASKSTPEGRAVIAGVGC
ncbi:MAG: hypothetical protein IH850_05515 [Acidobacteria bacterium]|nr:hypothetical protein [Acidobacteriota bacterium]